MKFLYKTVLLLFIFLGCFYPTQINAADPSSTRNQSTYVTNGSVDATIISTDKSKIYLGGNFTEVGPYTGHGALLNTGDGTWDTSMPKVDGVIYSVISDGADGWYIGGGFTTVGSTPRSGIAHILANKTVDPNWAANASSFSYSVYSLALSGSTLYVGGTFDITIDGVSRSKLMAINTSNGLVTSWNPSNNATTSNGIKTLLALGNTLYVGGDFTTLAGSTRRRIASFAIDTGSLTSWDPNVTTANSTVHTLLLSGTTLYVGGRFNTIGGQTRNNLSAISTSTGLASSWNPNINGGAATVYTIALSGTNLYVGGSFSGVAAQSISWLTAVDTGTGLSTWNPNASTIVRALAVSGTTLYVAGNFQSIDGQNRNYLASYDLNTNIIKSWDPHPSWPIYALSVSGSNIYAGGEFNSIGSQTRNYIAAIDANTGIPTNWNPNANYGVSSLLQKIPLHKRSLV